MNPIPSFWDTIGLDNAALLDASGKADKQENEILNFFSRKPDNDFTPAEVHAAFLKYPITSIRRAISNLKEQGRLIKTNKQRLGNYGKPNYTWRFNTNAEINI